MSEPQKIKELEAENRQLKIKILAAEMARIEAQIPLLQRIYQDCQKELQKLNQEQVEAAGFSRGEHNQ